MPEYNIKDLIELARHAASHTVPSNFTNVATADDVAATLREHLRNMAPDFNTYNQNKYQIFQIIQTVMGETVPKRINAIMDQFAEVRYIGNNQKVRFTQKVGKARAKKFITQVGLAGVYETFRLDKKDFEVSTHAYGGAAYIDFERFLNGEEVIADYMDAMTEGLADVIFGTIQNALRNAINATDRPVANYHTENTFDAADFQSLVNTVRAYGTGAVIFAPPEFIAAMGPDAIVPPIAGAAQGIYSPTDIEDIRRTGRIWMFRGTPIVEIPQSFVDDTNTEVWIDPQMAYIFPTGGEKVVKCVFEGTPIVTDFQNRDLSMELHSYQKFGVAILTNNNWAFYQNTGITAPTFYGPTVVRS
jgi:hypothetical protein